MPLSRFHGHMSGSELSITTYGSTVADYKMNIVIEFKKIVQIVVYSLVAVCLLLFILIDCY